MNVTTFVGIAAAVLAAATIYIQSLHPESRLQRLLFFKRGNAAALRLEDRGDASGRAATEGSRKSH